MCCARVATVSLEAITYLRASGGAADRSSPGAPTTRVVRRGVEVRKPRSGRSEAEWLDRTVDRRTISQRDGRRARGRATRQRTRKRSRRAGRKRGRRRDGRGPPQFRIQSRCALTYMNAVFRKNLTDALAVDARHTAGLAAHSAMARTGRGSAGRQQHASGA